MRDYPTKCVFNRETTQQSVYSLERLPNKVCILLIDYPTKCAFYKETSQQSVHSIERLPNKEFIL